jgi:TonB family protein
VDKLYHQPDAERAAKVQAMLACPPRDAEDGAFRLAWPREVLLDEDGGFAGFAMARAEGPRVFELYNPATRRERAPLFHHGLLHRAARNLAAAFASVHAAGYVVGDVNESNVLVDVESGAVTLVDTDSFQVRDEAGRVHRCKVGKPEFTPPELQGVTLGEVERTPEHDRFGLAVVLFQMLMEGTHPFAGQYPGAGDPPALETRIREGHFAYAGRPGSPSRPPRLAPPFGTLHPALQALFLRCFDAAATPSQRPAAAEWVEALEVAGAALVTCADNPQHRFGGHLGNCPWCERARLLGGRDPFPSAEHAARGDEEETPAPTVGRPWSVAERLANEGWCLPPMLAIYTLFVRGTTGILLGTTALCLGALVTVIARRIPPPVLPQARFAVVWPGLVLVLAVPGYLNDRVMQRAGPAAPAYTTEVAEQPELTDPAEPRPPAPTEPPSASSASATYDLEAVDQKPKLANPDELRFALSRAYPPELRDAGVEGQVEVEFRIDERGQVDRSTMVVTETTDPRFSEATLTALGQARFTPARIDGKAVAARIILPITWQVPR